MRLFEKFMGIFYINEDLAYTKPIRIFLVRLLELLLTSALLSLPIVGLNYLGILIRPLHVFIVTALAAAVFMLVQFRLQRKYYLSVNGVNRMFVPTIIAYLVYMALSVIAYFWNYNVFICLFGIMKFARYFVWFPLKDWASAVVFHILSILVITLSHLSMKNYVKSVNEEITEKKIMF